MTKVQVLVEAMASMKRAREACHLNRQARLPARENGRFVARVLHEPERHVEPDRFIEIRDPDVYTRSA